MMKSSMTIATGVEPNIWATARVIAPDQRNDNQHCPDGERNVGDRGQPLPE